MNDMRWVMIKVLISWDDEARVWIATSNDIDGLVLESESYDELIGKVRSAVPELMELNGCGTENNFDLAICSERHINYG